MACTVVLVAYCVRILAKEIHLVLFLCPEPKVLERGGLYLDEVPFANLHEDCIQTRRKLGHQ